MHSVILQNEIDCLDHNMYMYIFRIILGLLIRIIGTIGPIFIKCIQNLKKKMEAIWQNKNVVPKNSCLLSSIKIISILIAYIWGSPTCTCILCSFTVNISKFNTENGLIRGWFLIFLVPYRWNRGDYRFPRCLPVSPFVRPSVRPSVRQSTQCPSTRFSELFSVVFWDIGLKFGIWICLDMIQIF